MSYVRAISILNCVERVSRRGSRDTGRNSFRCRGLRLSPSLPVFVPGAD